MRNTVIVGNWKMNKTPSEAKAFMDTFNKLLVENKDLISDTMKFGIGAPAVDLELLSKEAPAGMYVAAENMHEEATGAFTGELSVDMIKAVGANSVILGHSERRAMFNETNEAVATKAAVAIKNNITPIIAFGETLEQYEAGETKDVVEKMVKASTKGLDLSKVILAYEPIWAIGTGKTATAQDAQEICKFVRSITQEDVIIQYGGSVKPENVAELMAMDDIDGALVGGASLEAESFVKLLTLNK